MANFARVARNGSGNGKGADVARGSGTDFKGDPLKANRQRFRFGAKSPTAAGGDVKKL